MTRPPMLIRLDPITLVDGVTSIDEMGVRVDLDGAVQRVCAEGSTSAIAVLTPDASGLCRIRAASDLPIAVNEYSVTEACLQHRDILRIGGATFTCVAGDSAEAQYHVNAYYRMSRDHLTALFNRRYLDEFLARIALRPGTGMLHVLMLDIDNFKSINDTFGHLAADDVLVEFGRRLMPFSDDNGIVARFGGEEFVVVRANGHEPELAARVHQQLTSRNYGDGESAFPVAVSIGVATCPSGHSDPRKLLTQADEQLAEAKRAGGNCWMPQSESPTSP